MMMSETDPFVIVIVGAGPRGTGVLERLLANVPELVPDRRIRIEMVDPYPPGAGRVWRREQSPLMWMNVVANDVTMFTDESVRCAGPIRPGPSLSEWAASRDADLIGMSYASRPLLSRYLSWFFGHIVGRRPENVTVGVRPARAERLEDGPDARQRVWLAGRAEPILADVVILTVGHLDANPDPVERRMADFARRHELGYLPRAYTVDADLSMLRPGESVVMRGFGLAFVDLMVLLTEGRGGGYRSQGGKLRYLPSGREPRLYVGSRRGLPYRAKFCYRLNRRMAPLPQFFDAATIIGRFAPRDSVDFRSDLWPLIAKEVGWGYYHELFNAHPDRVTMTWDDFSLRYSRFSWYGEEMRALVREGVPAAEDRLDFESLDQPLHGLRFTRFDELQDHVRDHVAADLARRSEPAYSADQAAFLAMLSVYRQMPTILPSIKLTGRSEVEDLAGWWQSFFEYFGSGPPGLRISQLLALSRAGIVQFLGADMWVEPDEKRGVFRSGSASSPHVTEATALVEARLPAANLCDCPDPLLRRLYESGGATEYVVTDEYGVHHGSGLLHVFDLDYRIMKRSGWPHPRRFALGPHTSIRSFAAFARPRSNALSFRQNDRLARIVLDLALASDAHTPEFERVLR